jgi:F-type H+-transporting ATPase subunit delta
VAAAEGKLAIVEAELYRVASAIESNASLRSALSDSGVELSRRLKIVEKLLGGRAHNVTTQLLSLVVGTGRLRDLPGIVERLVKRASDEGGLVVAEIRSAVPLTRAQQKILVAALQCRAGRPLNVKTVVDPSLLGGVVATVGDEVIDDSVRTRLDQVKGLI